MMSMSYYGDDDCTTVQRYPVALPECMHVDELATMSDEDLDARAQVLHQDRNKVIAHGSLDTRPWDVEFAYIQREFHMRRIRREAHERFMREQSRLFAEEEARLPSADFDNLRYVMLSNLRRNVVS